MGEFETLDQDEPLAQRLERHAYDRLIMLSDGVFAIAITIAAFEIRPPPNWDQNPASLPRLLGPALMAYAIAFLVISAYWMAHRRMIAMLRRVDGFATFLNLMLLGLVAIQPAAIRLLTDYKVNGGAGIIYFSQIVLMGVVQAGLWLYAWLKGGMIDSSIQRPARLLMLANILVSPVLGAWIGVSIGHTSNFRLGVLITGVAAASFARRTIGRRIGL